MVYGGTDREKISLNTDTLWSGYPKDKSCDNAYEGFMKARELTLDGKLTEAEEELWKNCLSDWTEAYIPAGNVYIDFGEKARIEHYHRELILDNATVFSAYRRAGINVKETVFCSYPDHVIAIRYRFDKPMDHIEVVLDSQNPYTTQGDTKLTMVSRAPSYCAPNYFQCDNPIIYDTPENNRAITYAVSVLPVAVNGETKIANSKITITNCSDFTVYITLATNFEGFDRQPKDSKIVPQKVCSERLDKIASKSYDDIFASHVEDYQSLYNRVSLKIEGKDDAHIPTDQRIERFMSDKSDNGIFVLLFDYGRYLSIASSRAGSQATNLQGIWNEEMRASWSSNYTININTEMNYWHMEACNLSECHMPLIQMIKEFSVNGQKTVPLPNWFQRAAFRMGQGVSRSRIGASSFIPVIWVAPGKKY